MPSLRQSQLIEEELSSLPVTEFLHLEQILAQVLEGNSPVVVLVNRDELAPEGFGLAFAQLRN